MFEMSPVLYATTTFFWKFWSATVFNNACLVYMSI